MAAVPGGPPPGFARPGFMGGPGLGGPGIPRGAPGPPLGPPPGFMGPPPGIPRPPLSAPPGAIAPAPGNIYAPPPLPGLPAMNGPLLPVRQELENLRNAMILQSQTIEQFKDNLHQAINAVLQTAIQNGNGTARIRAADIPLMQAEIAAAVAQAGNANLAGPAEEARTLSELNAQAPFLGGWTPKPRRKPTRRKRKSVKLPF